MPAASLDQRILEQRIRDAADSLAVARLLALARSGVVEARRGPGWSAVRSGAASNALNGVAVDAGAVVPEPVAAELVAWFTSVDVPATWLLPGGNPAMVARLTALGGRAETTGWWAGGPLPKLPAQPSDVVITVVATDADLDDWFAVGQACGWYDSPGDAALRRRLPSTAPSDPGDAVHRFVARRAGRPVGMAADFADGGLLELTDLAVLPGERRRGVGTALTAARLAARPDARLVVTAPSHDGWALHHALGLQAVRVAPDRAVYLP